ncbi:MAG: hypothetical protein ABEI78_02125 [Candidatus Nanohaloarchaea archaeon]
MGLRRIDKIGLTFLFLFEVFLFVSQGLGMFLGVNLVLLFLGVGLKLFNMYRMEPREIRRKKDEEGLSGLFC